MKRTHSLDRQECARLTSVHSECHAKGIALQLVIDPTIHTLDATCIIADPSRVAQVVVSDELSDFVTGGFPNLTPFLSR